MAVENVKFTINKKGEINIETSGFTGNACIDATKGIEDILSGGEFVNRTLKEEYEQPETLVRHVG